MQGDSVFIAMTLLGWAACCLLAAQARARKQAEAAAALLALTSMALLSFGYDIKVSWSFLVEGSAAACVAALLLALVQYGRRQLVEGDHD